MSVANDGRGAIAEALANALDTFSPYLGRWVSSAWNSSSMAERACAEYLRGKRLSAYGIMPCTREELGARVAVASSAIGRAIVREGASIEGLTTFLGELRPYPEYQAVLESAIDDIGACAYSGGEIHYREAALALAALKPWAALVKKSSNNALELLAGRDPRVHCPPWDSVACTPLGLDCLPLGLAWVIGGRLDLWAVEKMRHKHGGAWISTAVVIAFMQDELLAMFKSLYTLREYFTEREHAALFLRAAVAAQPQCMKFILSECPLPSRVIESIRNTGAIMCACDRFLLEWHRWAGTRWGIDEDWKHRIATLVSVAPETAQYFIDGASIEGKYPELTLEMVEIVSRGTEQEASHGSE